MNKDADAVLLDEVLFAFRRDNALPTPDAVSDWCRRHPRFAEDIQEEAMLWAEEEMMAALHRHLPEDEAVVQEARARAVKAVEHGAARVAAASSDTFADALRSAGIDQAEAARQLGMPASVLKRLIRGEIMGATIPQTFTYMLSRLLGQAEEWVLARYPATLAAAQDASCRPTPGAGFGTISFQEAVADADDATEEERAFWLEEA
ncbi:hypothetical protein DFH01_09705 [Falsiroseomonas bella]|uniref:Uncharacterized protein n=1 Tax=Falsiroseomonas bella TaxID=2184016 RepID=A0A317FF11_9PROT|nr:hypothetical protein [Falsiroseomonas bella]PWS37133.1 hypothetical protein DFH01_09705 [Falsiroseomonas bella]